VGTISGLGAALSTAVSGYLAWSFGPDAAFLAILGIAAAGAVGLWLFMPETKPLVLPPKPAIH